jgi:hypothetical protein
MTDEEKAAAEAAKNKEQTKTSADLAKQNEELSAKIKELDAKLLELSKPDPTLLDKAKKSREEEDKKVSDTKALENALRFAMKSEDFIKTNASLLPKDIADIFKQADKENYSNAIEKDAAIKSGIVQSFFAIQANVDLLTPGLKSSLDEYLKLTKTGKQDRAPAIYDGVFEPAFAMLKGIKKAEALNKGYSTEDDEKSAYKNRMIKMSKSHYLGEK